MKNSINSIRIKAYFFTASILLFLNDFVIAQRYMRGDRSTYGGDSSGGSFLAMLVILVLFVVAVFIWSSFSKHKPNQEPDPLGDGCSIVGIMIGLFVTLLIILYAINH